MVFAVQVARVYVDTLSQECFAFLKEAVFTHRNPVPQPSRRVLGVQFHRLAEQLFAGQEILVGSILVQAKHGIR